MNTGTARFLLTLALLSLVIQTVGAKGEAQRRWERMNQIRLEKFDLVLPEVMRENNVDMWITVNREGLEDPLTDDFGRDTSETTATTSSPIAAQVVSNGPYSVSAPRWSKITAPMTSSAAAKNSGSLSNSGTRRPSR